MLLQPFITVNDHVRAIPSIVDIVVEVPVVSAVMRTRASTISAEVIQTTPHFWKETECTCNQQDQTHSKQQYMYINPSLWRLSTGRLSTVETFHSCFTSPSPMDKRHRLNVFDNTISTSPTCASTAGSKHAVTDITNSTLIYTIDVPFTYRLL